MAKGRVVVMIVLAVVATACGVTSGGDLTIAPEPAVATPETLPSSTTVSPTTTTTTTTSTTTTTTTSTTTTVPRGAAYFAQSYSQYATVGPVALFHPAARVEFIGFHEAGHDGARQQDPLDDIAPWTTMDSRDRGTGSRTAADIAVAAEAEIRSPATGTVIRGGTYVLYCQYSDDFVVIEPDAAPGWEVKMFHFSGLQVGVGDRVEAGVTVVGLHATPLPFESQVNEFLAEPANPHVHVEVVDPSIPDTRTGGGC